MVAQTIALLISAILSVPAPDRLTEQGRILTALIPDGRVLAAQIDEMPNEPKIKENSDGPKISAESFVVIDVGSGSVIASRSPSAVRPVASLTKLLTAITVTQKARPQDNVLVGKNAINASMNGSDMKLRLGERITVQNLLAGLLINSANDAAIALSEHVSGKENLFALEMNEVAKNFGLTRTQARNATGFDNAEHFSTAYDMGLLLLHAWRDPLLGIYLRTESMTVPSADGKIKHHLNTTNRLLGARTDVLAGKTGFTDAAGQSLAIVGENDGGNPVIAVLLGSEDRFNDMEKLLDWVFNNFIWENK